MKDKREIYRRIQLPPLNGVARHTEGFFPLQEPRDVPAELAHCFQYGTAFFEGIRAFWSKKGELAIVSAQDNVDRFFSSMDAGGLTAIVIPESASRGPRPYDQSKDIFIDRNFTPQHLLDKLVELVQRHVANGSIKPGDQRTYIRPHAGRVELSSEVPGYIDEKELGVGSLRLNIEVSAFIMHWGAYFGESFDGLHLLIHKDPVEGEHFKTKASSNYGPTSIMRNEANLRGYDDIVRTNPQRRIQELSGANIAFIRGKTIVTPSTDMAILPGINRRIMTEMVVPLGYTVIQEDVRVSHLGQYEAAFAMGTAAGICEIADLHDDLTGITYSYNAKNTGLLRIKNEFDGLRTGGEVHSKNNDLQHRMRTSVAYTLK